MTSRRLQVERGAIAVVGGVLVAFLTIPLLALLVSTSAAEQSDGIVQVNQAVTHLDQMTQQNAALVEQSAAAAESLREQARRLSGAVNVFRLAA